MNQIWISYERDLEDVLSKAKKAIGRNRCIFGHSNDLFQEFIELKIDDSKEIWPLIFELLHEIAPKNFRSAPIESAIASEKFYNFQWTSEKMKKDMWIQFAIDGGIFYYFSLRPLKSKTLKIS